MTGKRDPVETLPAIDWQRFEGIRAPTYTQTPDEIFDWIMAYLTGAELKVLLYITRRTFGFKKAADAISVPQICTGLVTRDGRRLDLGTGLKRTTVLDALRSLQEKNLIIRHQQVDPETGSRPTLYALNVKTEFASSALPQSFPRSPPERTPPVRSGGPRGYDYTNSGVCQGKQGE